MLKFIGRRAPTTLLVTVALCAVPAGAQAMPVSVINTDGIGVSSRSAPADGARNGYGAPAGAAVETLCQTWGEAVGPYSNRLWWLVSYQGRSFYVNDRYLSTPTTANVPVPGQPWCGAAPVPQSAPPSGDLPSRVAQWVQARVGVVWASAADRSQLRATGSDWAARNDGPIGEWSGDCARFAYLAWSANGVRPVKAGTAKAVADAYARAGRLSGGVPPVGAIVFYHYGRYGHAGISVGGGQVVSTQGMDYARRPIRRHGYNSIGLGYRGWVDPR